MYNQSYEEYMKNLVGYPTRNYDTYNTNDNYQYQMSNTNQELEECYPEIYKVVYPMVCKACEKNREPITRQLINSMTNEIYMALEGNQEVNVNINLGNNVRGTTGTNISKKMEPKVENRSSESRQIGRNNFLLNDLIRILLVRELLGGRNNNFPQRPPFIPGRPGVGPNFPGGMGPNRPPIMPREFDSNFDIYEY